LIAEANRVIDKSIGINRMVQEGIGSKELFTANVNLLSEPKKRRSQLNTFFVFELAFRMNL